MHLATEKTLDWRTSVPSFRPLQGIMHLATMKSFLNFLNEAGFRPLQGDHAFSNLEKKLKLKGAYFLFPSPSGDHAFSNLRKAMEILNKCSFRPLQGIMHLATF